MADRSRAHLRPESTDTVGAGPLRRGGFVWPELPAWLRVWVGKSDGFVRREEMRTDGHIMDYAWASFIIPVGLRPPR